MRKTKFGVLLLSAILFNVPAEAQLSTNPWLNPNSEEDIAEVYRKNRKNNAPEFYNGDDTVLEESPTLPEDNKSDEGVLDKVKNLFSKNEDTSSTQPVETTETTPVRRRIISGGKKISRARSGGGSGAGQESSGGFGDFGNLGFSGGEFSNMARKVKRSFNSITRQFK